MTFSDHPEDFWTIDDAMKGTSIIGGTGSGKTSASGKAIAIKFLEKGWGGLVLCAKSDEADLWREYCKDAKRTDDLIVFSKGSRHEKGKYEGQEIVFNPIDYELKRPGEGAGETQNITNIFMNIYRMGNRIASEGDTHEERFWDTALKRCLNRIIELIKLAKEDLSYDNMTRILSTSNNISREMFSSIYKRLKNDEEVEELRGSNAFCMLCLIAAYNNVHNKPSKRVEEVNGMSLASEYFLNTLQLMSTRTKSIITESFMGLAEPFLSGILSRHFSGTTNIFPEETYKNQKIIVLDFPIKEYLDAGIIAQSVFKLMFQQALERRDIKQFPTPVFLWCDEAQYFVNPYDQLFLTTARSSRTATVFLSQNISNYLAVMGSGGDAKARVDSLMGNLSTKIFHANSDAETNEYASRLIGNNIIYLDSYSSSRPLTGLSEQTSETRSGQFLPQVHPRKFTTMLMGGEANNYDVEALIFVTGKTWSSKINYLETFFKQEFKE